MRKPKNPSPAARSAAGELLAIPLAIKEFASLIDKQAEALENMATLVEELGHVVSITEVPSVDELVEALRPHRQEILHADEWRSLANHVRQLILACVKGSEQKGQKR